MGYIKHDAILVTGYDHDCLDVPHAHAIRDARAKAVELGLEALCTPVLRSPMNGYASFLVAPDGSKEGWTESDHYDEKRATFLDWLRAGQTFVDWCCVRFGGDEPGMTSVEFNGERE